MTSLRVGTRGSELALAQTRWVCDRLRAQNPQFAVDEIVVRTSGDDASERAAETEWPVGAFVSAIEKALLAGDVDFAVHSCKDLPTTPTPGLMVIAIPEREVAGDVLVTGRVVDLRRLPAGLRIGTGSPRRAAQFRRLGPVEIVPIRGNVPTRLARVQSGELDGVIVAAAGLRRLGLSLAHAIELPHDRFPAAPGQGALAVQVREGHPAGPALRALDHAPTRRAVEAERAFLHRLGSGCRMAAAAYAEAVGSRITLHAQLFGDDGTAWVETTDSGTEPTELGARVADGLRRRLSRGD